jgi:hypothetical protein
MLPLLLIMFASLAVARADPAPVRQAGEWQTVLTSSLAGAATQEKKACYRAESADQIFRNMPGCGNVAPVTTGSRTTFDAICTRGSTVVTMHGEIEARGPEAFHAQMHATYAPPVGALSEMTVTGDSKWLGPCPPGEAPAD